MSNETNLNDISTQIPLPCIEKPAIRIDLGIRLRELDEYIAANAAKISPEEYNLPDVVVIYDPDDLLPNALKRLRMEYLEVDDVSPVLDFTRDDTSSKNVSLIYQANEDLTMRELGEFVNSVKNKLYTIIVLDLKKDLSQSIRRISIYGARKRAEEEILGIIDDIIDYINECAAGKYTPFMLESLPFVIEIEREKYGGWAKDIDLTHSIAEKIDALIKILVKIFQS